jgi:hypothetical protein
MRVLAVSGSEIPWSLLETLVISLSNMVSSSTIARLDLVIATAACRTPVDRLQLVRIACGIFVDAVGHLSTTQATLGNSGVLKIVE